MLVALVGVAGAVPHVAVGPVRSIVTAVAVAAVAGPVLPARSDTAPAARRGATVPSEQLLAVTVTEVPDVAEAANVQPVAVPAFEKSPGAMPDTDSLKVSVNAGAAADVGDAGEVHDAVGGARSTVTVGAVVEAPGNAVPEPSFTAFASSDRMTVPDVPLPPPTVTV